MKRIASFMLLALLVGGSLWPQAADATVSRGADCRQCHSFSNQPPVANAGTDQTVSAGTSVTLNGSGSTDSDDGIASYAWTQSGGPSVTISNANTSRATFTAPAVTAQTTLTFTLTVRDRLPQSSTDTCVVTVRPAETPTTNKPPVANAGPDQTVSPGARVTLNGSGSSDPDGVIASYTWTQTGGGAVTLSGANTVNPTFTAPRITPATDLTFRLTVADGSSATSSDTVVVRVSTSGGTPTGTPPVADAGLDQSVLPGTLNTLSGFYSTDTDGAVASYAWTQTGGPAVTLSDPSAMTPVFQAPNTLETLTFRLVVTDSSGLQDDDLCTVVVGASGGGTTPPPPSGNQPPVARAGQDQTVTSGATVRLSGSGSTDPDDGIASHRWRQISGTSVSLSGSSSANALFRAPSVGSRGVTLIFELTVRDRAGLSASDTVVINVSSGDSGDDEEDDD